MADISAIFGILLSLGIVFPGMLTAWWLLFPATVERARLRLDRTPWKCFFVGGVVTAMLAIPITILFVIPNGAVQFVGWALLFITLTIASLGAAGLAAKMGDRLSRRSSDGFTPVGALVRGAVALELAAAFPVIGWVIVIPLATVTAVGATAFALLHWVPRPAPQSLPENTSVSQA